MGGSPCDWFTLWVAFSAFCRRSSSLAPGDPASQRLLPPLGLCLLGPGIRAGCQPGSACPGHGPDRVAPVWSASLLVGGTVTPPSSVAAPHTHCPPLSAMSASAGSSPPSSQSAALPSSSAWPLSASGYSRSFSSIAPAPSIAGTHWLLLTSAHAPRSGAGEGAWGVTEGARAPLPPAVCSRNGNTTSSP